MPSIRPWLAIFFAWRRPLAAYAISVVVHAAALVGFGTMALEAGHRTSTAPSLDAEFRAPIALEQARACRVTQGFPKTLGIAHSAGQVHGAGGGFGGVGIGLPAPVAIALEDVGRSQPAGFELAAAPTGVGLAGATDVQLGEVGAQERKPSASFFGTSAGGRNFVFVVDVYSSMNEGGRFRRAKFELKKTLEGLSSQQQFFIIFFSDDAVPLPVPGLVSATPKNTKDTMRWINSIQPDGDTYPLSALMMALRLEPDAIFLLSDGQFDPQVIFVVSQTQGTSRPIPIHTIALVSRVGEPVMKALSQASGGTFRFVH